MAKDQRLAPFVNEVDEWQKFCIAYNILKIQAFDHYGHHHHVADFTALTILPILVIFLISLF